VTLAIECKEMHEWASWRDEYTLADVEKALAFAGLKGWKFDHWSDGDAQFMHPGPVTFDDLAKLRVTFTPRSMVVEAVVDQDAEDERLVAWERAGANPLDRGATALMVLVTMSWNEVSDAGAA